MKKYLQTKVDEEDYHAVWDAAIDIDRLQTELQYSLEMEKLLA